MPINFGKLNMNEPIDNPTYLKYGVNLIKEEGYFPALYGLGFSYGITKPFTYFEFQKNTALVEKMRAVANNLATLGDGHNKFRESIQVWFEWVATRKLWQEEATYRVGISRQSQSTMHTLHKNDIYTERHFLSPHKNSSASAKEVFAQYLELLNRLNKEGNKKTEVPALLAESFLQGRVVCVNYQTIDHFMIQRINHNLCLFEVKEWREACLSLYSQLEHPELLSVKLVNGLLQKKMKLVPVDNKVE